MCGGKGDLSPIDKYKCEHDGEAARRFGNGRRYAKWSQLEVFNE
jgi:hypothetical protein